MRWLLLGVALGWVSHRAWEAVLEAASVLDGER